MEANHLTMEQEAEIKRIVDVTMECAKREVNSMVRLLAGKKDTELLGETEFQIRDAVHKIGAKLIEAALQGRKKGGYVGSSHLCEECQNATKFEGYRDKTVMSLLGPITLSRAYYSCSHCHHGIIPWNETLRLGKHGVTPGAEEVASMAGCVDSFGQAAKRLLKRMSGIEFSESTIQRIAEDAGKRVGDQLNDGMTFGPNQQWDFFQDVEGKSVGYISVDATSVPQQGPKGAKAEGRMPYVGMLYNPPPADWEVNNQNGKRDTLAA